RSAGDRRFQNYRARFTVLDAAAISRVWINSIIAGAPEDGLAPEAWLTWRKSGRRKPLIATRSIEYRSRREQIPADAEGEAMIQTIRSYFQGRPHAFEHCAAAIARLMIPDIASLD